MTVVFADAPLAWVAAGTRCSGTKGRSVVTASYTRHHPTRCAAAVALMTAGERCAVVDVYIAGGDYMTSAVGKNSVLHTKLYVGRNQRLSNVAVYK